MNQFLEPCIFDRAGDHLGDQNLYHRETESNGFFDETFVIPHPLVPTPDGLGVMRYNGSDAGQITVGGELNKLASNVGFGRVFSGIHWRRDIVEGMLLGEAVAISLLRDQGHLYNENYQGFTFTKFDGTTITV